MTGIMDRIICWSSDASTSLLIGLVPHIEIPFNGVRTDYGLCGQDGRNAHCALTGESMAFELKLKELELANFHQFEHYAIDFDEHVTVLVGDNGSGKSTILDAASVALGGVPLPPRFVARPYLFRCPCRAL